MSPFYHRACTSLLLQLLISLHNESALYSTYLYSICLPVGEALRKFEIIPVPIVSATSGGDQY